MSRNRQRSFKKQIKKEKQREKEIKNQNKKSMRFDNKKEPEKTYSIASLKQEVILKLLAKSKKDSKFKMINVQMQ
jgi:hypothetical protein